MATRLIHVKARPTTASLADAVLTSFLDFVRGNAAAIFSVVLDLAHAQIEQIVATNFLAM